AGWAGHSFDALTYLLFRRRVGFRDDLEHLAIICRAAPVRLASDIGLCGRTSRPPSICHLAAALRAPAQALDPGDQASVSATIARTSCQQELARPSMPVCWP